MADQSADQPVLIERDGHRAEIILNRPSALNAINTAMARALLAACQEISSDREVWVVLLRGAGDRAFCVGADLKERKSFADSDWQGQRSLFRSMFQALREMPQPVIAAVHGFALGGGTELALLSDCVVASDNAEFGLPEAHVGLIPAGNGVLILPRLVGLARAKEILFSGRRIHASEALSLGIASMVVPADELLSRSRAMADAFMANSPSALRAIKQLANRALWATWKEALELEEAAYQTVLASADRREGIAAFNERRPPRWTGR